jgi:hypothetical protein
LVIERADGEIIAVECKSGSAVGSNDLEGFSSFGSWSNGERELVRGEWHCHLGVEWPPEVVKVEVLDIRGKYFAVGKDARGKVRKPSTYRSVDLEPLVRASC